MMIHRETSLPTFGGGKIFLLTQKRRKIPSSVRKDSYVMYFNIHCFQAISLEDKNRRVFCMSVRKKGEVGKIFFLQQKEK